MSEKQYSALVMAGSSRRRGGDSLLEAGGVSHKCFLDIAGQPMLQRVIKSVLGSGRIGHVYVSIDEEIIPQAREVIAPLGHTDMISFIPSQGHLGDSVLAVTESRPDALPLVITTGDNALHTDQMVRYFCEQLDNCDDDVALGLTRAEVLLEKYPDGQRSFHRFRDGQFSSCNLYALMTEKALTAPKTFNSGGQFAKKPWRIAVSFGLVPLLVYKSRLATLGGFLKSLSRSLRLDIAPVFMPFAEGPIDVDRVSDWEMANRIVAARSSAEEKTH